MSDRDQRLVIGGIPISRLTAADLCAAMVDDVRRAHSGSLLRPRLVTSANGFVIAQYNRSARFKCLVDQMDIVDPDGMPLVWASRMFHEDPLTERVATTDWVLQACDVARNEGLRFYFLGSRPGVAARAAAHLVNRFPGLQIAGVNHGYIAGEDFEALCERIVASKADVLWLGMGSPLQEEVALKFADRLPGVGWIRTCGGLFDHYGGGVSRAPGWMQAAGLEWLYRAAREPVRLGLRYLITNPYALYCLLFKTRKDRQE